MFLIYKEFAGDRLSMLGMGCMRFPCDENGAVDMEKTGEMIDLCIENGVNYFDTAWFYHDGKSEAIIGKLLSKYDRGSFYLATKMPWTDINSPEDAEVIFRKQLENTGAGYFDYYLLHNISKETIDIFTDESLRIVDFLYEQKKAGKIRHLGFSAHADLAMMEDFIIKYRDKMEFCQIQLNWLDWTLQQAREKVELLKKYNLPIWVMEPVRGGKLANLNREDEEQLRKMRPDESIAAWSFRFLQGIDGIKMVLSGMSNDEQVRDNIKTFSSEKLLSEEERGVLLSIADKILSKKILTCTGCKYCVPQCPKGLNIPKILSVYNDVYVLGAKRDDEETKSAAIECIGCSRCEQKCPQQIKISEIMKDYSDKM